MDQGPIEAEFKFSFYNPRFKHNMDEFHIKRTEAGWHGGFADFYGDWGMNGEPHLYKYLRNEYISYPVNLGSYWEDIWYRANEGKLSNEEIQDRLNQLVEWVNTTTKARPSW
jgi:hypothetical protein